MNHCGSKELETARLLLRPVQEGDAPALYRMFSDIQVVKYLRVPLYDAVERAKEFIADVLKNGYTKPDFYYWVLEEKAENRVVGSIVLRTLSAPDEVGTVGFGLAQAYWRRGFMAEALKAVLSFGLLEVGYNRIEADHAVANSRSGAVMRGAGMLYEGMCREKFKNHRGYHDTNVYAILKKDVM